MRPRVVLRLKRRRVVKFLGLSGQPDSAARPPASVATPASQTLDDVVPATPSPLHTSDPVLRRLLEVNTEGLRKRRIGLGFSPEIQVSQPGPKHRLLSAKLNISSLIEFVTLLSISRSISLL